MSIFSSKKSRPRDIDVDRSKPRAVSANGANGQTGKNGTASAISNAALSAGARTIQRAQIMAASRKRMNSETPDYSIQGAAKGQSTPHKASVPSAASVSAARQAVQGAAEPKNRTAKTPAKIAKRQHQNNEEKKSRASRASSVNNVVQSGATTPIYAAMQAGSSPSLTQKPNDAAQANITSGPFMAVQKTPPMPMDSPTLGYDGTFTKPEPRSTAGSVSAAPSSNAISRTQTDVNASQEVRIGRLSRNDSGFVSEPDTNKDAVQEPRKSKSSIDKSAGVPPGIRAESKASNRSSRSSTFISRLDPGPSASIFAEPVEPSKAIVLQPDNEDINKRPRQTSRPQKFQVAEADTPKATSGSAIAKQPQPQPSFSISRNTSSSGLNRIVVASQAQPAPKMAVSAPQSRREERPFAAPPRSSTPPATTSRGIESRRESASKLHMPPASSPAEGFRTAPTSTSNTPPRSREGSLAKAPLIDSYFSRPTTTQEVQPPAPTVPVVPQPAVTTPSTSDQRPPVSVLEGFKVNKRGHVLDEEGEVIGELFEGDLIDCVRQKVDANGDVLDESGVPVGRARTIIKGTVLAPRWSISSGVSLPLSTYQWGRRDSSSSQQTQQSHPTFFNRPSVSHAPPPAVEGNTIIAELDGSNEVEAGPVLDHSEIFSPFGAPKRPDSSSTVTNRTELAAEESSNAQSINSEARRESWTVEPMPRPVRKWTSRYFESSPIDGQLPPRRNSATPDMVRSPSAQSFASTKSPSVMYGAVSPTRSRAVIGPTLESLMEQDPSIFSSSPAKSSFGASTPNLPLEGTRSGASTPRSPSMQFGAPAPGMAASRLSVKGAYGHQPLRRSPLGNFETTPPGSGNGGTDDDQARAKSLPPAGRRAYNTKSGKASADMEDAAPAPEVSRAKWQEKRALLAVADTEKTLGRKKSRFSFMMGKKE